MRPYFPGTEKIKKNKHGYYPVSNVYSSGVLSKWTIIIFIKSILTGNYYTITKGIKVYFVHYRFHSTDNFGDTHYFRCFKLDVVITFNADFISRDEGWKRFKEEFKDYIKSKENE